MAYNEVDSEWVDVAGDGKFEGAEVGEVDWRWLNASQADHSGTVEQRTHLLSSVADVNNLSSLHLRAFLVDTSVQTPQTVAAKPTIQQEIIEIPDNLSFDCWDE